MDEHFTQHNYPNKVQINNNNNNSHQELVAYLLSNSDVKLARTEPVKSGLLSITPSLRNLWREAGGNSFTPLASTIKPSAVAYVFKLAIKSESCQGTQEYKNI